MEKKVEQPVAISPLVAQIITASLTATQHATNNVVENLTYRLAEAHARELAVEKGILALLQGPYAPSTLEIERALFPRRELIEHFMAKAEEES